MSKNKSVTTGLAGAALALVLAGCVVMVPDGHGERGRDQHGQDKVTICHKGKKTLVLPESAVGAHIGHGDTYGPCE